MVYPKRKIQLSPRLRYGIGQSNQNSKLLKITGVIFLVVAGVLTVNTLRLIPSNKPASGQPQVLGAQDTTEQPAPQFIEYTVKKGDTLFNIGQEYGVDWTRLMIINNLDSATLKTGQKLKVPTK